MNVLDGVGFFRLARNTAKLSDCRYKVGAVIAKKRPVAVGFNISRTHPQYSNPENTYKTTIHAEVRAVLNCDPGHVTGSKIYVYRSDASGKPAYARPCRDCVAVLKRLGVKQMIYTTDEMPFYCVERLTT